jgi:hypothetical protein
MNIFHHSLFSLTLLTAGFSVSAPAFAQAKVLVTPEAVIVNGVRGNKAPETRTLSVRATAPISNLRVNAFDLYNAERDRVFPKGLITVPNRIPPIAVDQPQDLPVTFSWQEAPSGEFLGNLVITQQGTELLVPITVRVKDGWLWPLVLLVGGVILGTTVSSYSRWGRGTDEVTANLERLQRQVESEQTFPASFKSRILMHLVDAKTARDSKKLEAAQQAIVEAETLWNRWFRQQLDWTTALENGDALKHRLSQLPFLDTETRYIQFIQRDLNKALMQVVDYNSPQELSEKIELLSRQEAFFQNVSRQFLRLQFSLAQFDPSPLEPALQKEFQVLQQKVGELRRQLNTLPPSDQPEQAELKDAETAIHEMTDALKGLQERARENLPADRLPKFQIGAEKNVILPPQPIPPSVAPSSEAAEVIPSAIEDNPVLHLIPIVIPNPNRRLQVFSFATWLITVAFLSGIGFNQLYLNRPTFGADRPRDYFSLLAWGFGAEATRSVVTNALRRSDGSA